MRGHRRERSFSFEDVNRLQTELASVDERISQLRLELDQGSEVDGSSFVESNAAQIAKSTLLAMDLCRYAADGNVEMVDSIIESGAEVNDKDYEGRTPLHIAAAKGYTEVVKKLLEHGADPNALDEDGFSPQQSALHNGFVETADSFFVPVGNEPESLSNGSLYSVSMGTTPVALTPVMSPGILATCTDAVLRREKNFPGMVVIMVGLPGRGKTYIAQEILRYFSWNAFACKMMSHAEFRRKNSTFHGPPEGETLVAKQIAKAIQLFLQHSEGIAILDGTNSTTSRRQNLLHWILQSTSVPKNRIIFVEVLNDDADVVHSNVLRAQEVSKDSPQFVEKYYNNINQHKEVYKTLSLQHDGETSWIRYIDGVSLQLNRIEGVVPSRLAYMLQNLGRRPVTLYITLCGESEYEAAGRVGGDSKLTDRGEVYAQELFKFMSKEMGRKPFCVLSSCSKRALQSCKHFHNVAQSDFLRLDPANEDGPLCRISYVPTLDELGYGDCEGQLVSEIRRTLPNTFESLEKDPFNVAWPSGESVSQMYATRLEPHIHEIHASPVPVLVVTHWRNAQGLGHFFSAADGTPPEESLNFKFPRETIVRIRPHGDKKLTDYIDLSKEVTTIVKT